ncbi:MAG: 2'-5' RNA ligase family protein [Gammaproteobacteria bacterium]|nr:2'-5' RNA ligase family protein [Gammaproteobacteria bacterium]
MKLVVISYPDLSREAAQWINEVRAHHDSHASLVAPHVTLVFPWETIDIEQVTAHVADVARQWTPIHICFDTVVRYADRLSPLSYAFLTASTDAQPLISLHDQLYTGCLEDERMTDIPYLPHIRLGDFSEPARCQRLVAEMRSHPIHIMADIKTLEVAAVEQSCVRTIERIALQSAAPSAT